MRDRERKLQAIAQNSPAVIHTKAIDGRSVGELIDGLLQRSRTARGALRRDAVEITARAGRILDELARHDIQRRVRVPVAPGLEAWADARMVEVVLRNLFSKAWKYTSKPADPEIRVEPVAMDGQPGVRVADDGVGLDIAHGAKLFQRPHRPDEFLTLRAPRQVNLASRMDVARDGQQGLDHPGGRGKSAETVVRLGVYRLATNEPPAP